MTTVKTGNRKPFGDVIVGTFITYTQSLVFAHQAHVALASKNMVASSFNKTKMMITKMPTLRLYSPITKGLSLTHSLRLIDSFFSSKSLFCTSLLSLKLHMHIQKPDERIGTEVFPDILRIKQSSMCAGPDKCGLLYCSIIQWSVTCNNSARKVWEITTCQSNCSPTYGISELSSGSSPHLSALPGLDRSQRTHPPKSRASEPLNKTTVCCVVNGYKITNTLNISHSSLCDKSSSDCASSSPCVNTLPCPGLSQRDSFPARIPPLYHLNDSGRHLSPQLIVSATRTWHLSIAVRLRFHWWFSSASCSSLCKTLLSLIWVSGEGIWSLMNEAKGR